MSGITYPLTVSVEGMDIRLMDENEKILNTNLKSGEDIVISDATIQKLIVSGELLPTDYSLEQNYPNPFNPMTKIRYSVPFTDRINISIYNILGEMVTTLVNQIQEAGRYEIKFDATQFASGIYIYRMETSNYSSVKKMIVIK